MIGLENQFLVFLSGCFRLVLLYIVLGSEEKKKTYLPSSVHHSILSDFLNSELLCESFDNNVNLEGIDWIQ